MSKFDGNSKPYLHMLHVQPYDRYIPSAFDNSLSILEKINKVIHQMNQIGVITNDLIEQWNNMYEWITGEGITETVEKLIDEKIADGTFDALFDIIVGDLSLLTTMDKTDIVHAINSVNALASVNYDNIGDATKITGTIVENVLDLLARMAIVEQATLFLGEATGSGVISGLEVTQQPILSMAVQVGNSTTPNIIHLPNGERYVLDSVVLPVNNAHATLNRIDIIYVDTNGVIRYTAGVADVNPVQPSTPTGGELLASIYVQAGDTTVNNVDITDRREMKSLDYLLTQNKSNFVQAINEVVRNLNTTTSDIQADLQQIQNDIGVNVNDRITELRNEIGDLQDLETSDKTTIVTSVNEVLKKFMDDVGDLQQLSTTDKTNVVMAMNEIIASFTNKIGDLNNLDVTDKSNLVNALNSAYTELMLNKVDKNTLMVNVKDFGAIGNGVANETASFNKAIEYAHTYGGTVFIPKGTYMLEPILLPANTTLMGSGMNETIIKLIDGHNDAVIIASETDNITLSHMTVDGNGERKTSGSTITLWRSRFNRIDNVRVINSNTIGLEMSNVTNSIIENSHFIGSTENCVVSFSNDTVDYSIGNNIVKGNIMEEGALDGIIYNTNGGIISENIFRNNGKRSGWTAGGVYANAKYQLVITNNIIEANNGNGVDVIDCGNMIVANNISYNNNSAGIMFAGCKNSNIENNICFNNGKAPATDQEDGITLLGACQNIIITGNRCFDSGSPDAKKQPYGIHVSGASQNILIMGNICSDNVYEDGILIDTNASGILLKNNLPLVKNQISEMNIDFTLAPNATYPLVLGQRLAVVSVFDISSNAFVNVLLKGSEKTTQFLSDNVEDFVLGSEASTVFSSIYHDGVNYVVRNNRATAAYYSYRITSIV